MARLQISIKKSGFLKKEENCYPHVFVKECKFIENRE